MKKHNPVTSMLLVLATVNVVFALALVNTFVPR